MGELLTSEVTPSEKRQLPSLKWPIYSICIASVINAFSLGIPVHGAWNIPVTIFFFMVVALGCAGFATFILAFVIGFFSHNLILSSRCIILGLNLLYWSAVFSPVAILLVNYGQKPFLMPVFGD